MRVYTYWERRTRVTGKRELRMATTGKLGALYERVYILGASYESYWKAGSAWNYDEMCTATISLAETKKPTN